MSCDASQRLLLRIPAKGRNIRDSAATDQDHTSKCRHQDVMCYCCPAQSRSRNVHQTRRFQPGAAKQGCSAQHTVEKFGGGAGSRGNEAASGGRGTQKRRGFSCNAVSSVGIHWQWPGRLEGRGAIVGVSRDRDRGVGASATKGESNGTSLSASGTCLRCLGWSFAMQDGPKMSREMVSA